MSKKTVRDNVINIKYPNNSSLTIKKKKQKFLLLIKIKIIIFKTLLNMIVYYSLNKIF